MLIIAVDTIPSVVECDESFVQPPYEVIHKYEVNDQACVLQSSVQGAGAFHICSGNN